MIPKVSIVVPMYGVEPFLNKCVDSLLLNHYTILKLF